MDKKALFGLVALLMALMLVSPVFAWTYWDGTGDTKFETFGPRVDKLLIKLYASDISEWDTGLEGGEIDVTDWPLDAAHYEEYVLDPRFHVLGYGAEFGLFLFDLNNNGNQYLGNPPDPEYPNPVYPNPMGYPLEESDNLYDDGWALRYAIAHLIDRDALVQYVGPALATPIYTVVPPCFGKYMIPLEQIWDHVKYDPTLASHVLNESGLFPYDPVSGWRYWDRNKNGQKDSGEDFKLKVFVRSDHAGRKKAGEMLLEEFAKSDPLIRIPYEATFGDISAARLQVMTNKDFHIYTGGWSLGVDPDHVILWNWDFYWHPGRPYNYAGINKDILNEASYGVMYANTQADAVYWCWEFQRAFAETAASVPLYSAAGYKAMSKTYVGDETPYSGKEWTNMVNWPGYGVDNGYTFLNMHVNTSEWMPGGVIRYGFKTTDIRQLNPIYSEWLWDNTVLDLIGYESLLARNPYTLDFIPWVAKAFEVGTYEHPEFGECTKIKFVIRNDVYFQDGEKLDVNDIKFTFYEIKGILESRSLAPPWWISNVQNILTFDIIDPQTFEVLLDVKSVFAVGWIGGNRILPEHIWRPICTTGDPSGFAPDPNLIGSGPWRLDEYVPNSHILLVANKPGSIVDTGLPGSVPVESSKGFFRLMPAYVDVQPAGYTVVVPPDVSFNLVSTVKNLMDVHGGCGDHTTLEGIKYVWIDDTLLVNGKTVTLSPKATDTDTNSISLPRGLHWAKIAFEITGPSEIAETWVNATWPIYATIREDINLDFFVNAKDAVALGTAFGSRPGDPNWKGACDINGDGFVNAKDAVKLGAVFGWPS